MDLQLKKVQETRINDCKKIIGYLNLVNFATLDDKEVRALAMIREMSNTIVSGHAKLATEGDVSRLLTISVERMVGACRKVVDQICKVDIQDLNEHERQILLEISKLGQGFIPEKDVLALNLHEELDKEEELGEGLVGEETQIKPSEEMDNEQEHVDGWLGENVTIEDGLVTDEVASENFAIEMETDSSNPGGRTSSEQFSKLGNHDRGRNFRSKNEKAIRNNSPSVQQFCSPSMSFGADFAAVGISSPPSWNVIWVDDEGSTRQVDLPKVSEAEGLPLPAELENPHKSNYEYLFNLVGSLKNEIIRKDNQLKDYVLKHDQESSLLLQDNPLEQVHCTSPENETEEEHRLRPRAKSA
uniref:Serine/threonine-protein phosphatase 7 inactive homolog isoform X1 n=1 Tax=Rhizophora mucronata TaxID=61149 RepID=A0A2P2JIL4_RHIMU